MLNCFLFNFNANKFIIYNLSLKKNGIDFLFKINIFFNLIVSTIL